MFEFTGQKERDERLAKLAQSLHRDGRGWNEADEYGLPPPLKLNTPVASALPACG